ncbi:hypothetical protein BDR05DRAFT_950786 [Suillus weaverae]|nr:hypothetical protein BDR05DRAFT_950786 [Suillus weaverae]
MSELPNPPYDNLELESESHTDSGPGAPPLVQATVISSAPILNLISQAPQEPDSIYSATPHPSQFLYSAQSPEPCDKICVRDTIYTIKRILFDHWVQGKEDQVILNEIDMLKHMSGVPGIPTLVDWWIVERSNGDADMTRKYRTQPQCPSLSGTSCSHVWLVLTPCTRPLHMFQTLKEFVKVLRDIVIVQRTAVEEHKVLHCNCSLNNAMIIDQLEGGSRGILIDWKFAMRINSDLKYVIRVCMSGTDQVHQNQVRNSIPDRWNDVDLKSCTAFKGNFFASVKEEQCLINEIDPYFHGLIPLAKEWHTALKDNDTMENPISFNDILALLNSHLDCLPDDKELISTIKMLKESAALLADHVEKCAASQSFPMRLLKQQKSDGDSHDGILTQSSDS